MASFQYHSHLSEKTLCRIWHHISRFADWLPGFIGPVPPPLAIRDTFYSVVLTIQASLLSVNNRDLSDSLTSVTNHRASQIAANTLLPVNRPTSCSLPTSFDCLPIDDNNPRADDKRTSGAMLKQSGARPAHI